MTVSAVSRSQPVVPPLVDGAKPSVMATDGVKPAARTQVEPMALKTDDVDPVATMTERRRLSRRLRRCVAATKPVKGNDERLLVGRLRGRNVETKPVKESSRCWLVA